MDGQTDRFAISISRVSMLTRDKNLQCTAYHPALEHFGLSLEVNRPRTILGVGQTHKGTAPQSYALQNTTQSPVVKFPNVWRCSTVHV